VFPQRVRALLEPPTSPVEVSDPHPGAQQTCRIVRRREASAVPGDLSAHRDSGSHPSRRCWIRGRSRLGRRRRALPRTGRWRGRAKTGDPGIPWLRTHLAAW